MSDDEDYLSDKFLAGATASTSTPKTYSALRREAQKRSQLKTLENRTKSRRQRELESREEGLNKSLFARAQEEQNGGLGSGNTALSIMMKMGFKPGQSLGHTGGDDSPKVTPTSPPKHASNDAGPIVGHESSRHKVEPLPIQEWAGKKGIGSLKRPPSPTSRERVAKMAKMAEESSREDFRDRVRQQYEDKRAEASLRPAQQTCITFDEKEGISFNILWLDPNDPETFPEGLINALELYTTFESRGVRAGGDSIEGRLRQQMWADALGPPAGGDESHKKDLASEPEYTKDVLEEAAQFLRLQARDRLDLVLSYLRERYLYCYWCGTQYVHEAEMKEDCPGGDEELHD